MPFRKNWEEFGEFFGGWISQIFGNSGGCVNSRKIENSEMGNSQKMKSLGVEKYTKQISPAVGCF